MEGISELLDTVSDALLVCHISPNGTSSLCEVTAINRKARALLDWTGPLLLPAPIEKVIQSPSLLDSINLALNQPTNAAEHPAIFTTGSVSLTLTVKTLSKYILVQLQEAQPLHGWKEALWSHMNHNPLVATSILEAVRRPDGSLENLRVVYMNQKARESYPAGEIDPQGQLLTDLYPTSRENGYYNSYAQVIETGIPLKSEKYYPELDQVFEVTASKHGDGLIVTYHNTTDKYRARQKAELQNQALLRIMEASEDAMALLTPILNGLGQVTDFAFGQTNQAARRLSIFQPPVSGDLTLSQLSLIDPDILKAYTEVLETGQSRRLEHPFSRDNSMLWLDISISRLENQLLLVGKDITPQKAAHEELLQQNQQLDGIINSSVNLMVVLEAERDNNGQVTDLLITQANQKARQMLGNFLDYDYLGQSVFRITGHKPVLFDSFVQVLETGQPVGLDEYFEAVYSRWYKVHIRRVYQSLVVTYIDIDDIQQSRLQAEYDNALLSGVLNSSFDGIFTLSLIRNSDGEVVDFTILMVNKQAVQLSMRSKEVLLSQSYLTHFPMTRESGVYQDIKDAFVRQVPLIREMSSFSPLSGEEKKFDLSAIPTSTDLLILTFRDITQQVALRQEQNRLLDELKRSNQSLEQFAYIASHDLQEPARKIKSFGEILVRQYAAEIPPAGQDMMQRMMSASARMLEMIDGLLTYSRFSQQPLLRDTVALGEVVSKVITDLELMIQEKDAQIRVGTLPVLHGDAPQLYQLFLNLVSNALKFSSPDTRPEITIAATAPNEAELASLSNADTTTWRAIRVEDNGIGFDPVHQHRVFELFARLNGRSEYSGHGLGLAICKVVAEQHGGSITVESQPNAGTTFTILLPVLS
ncbi:MAG: PAS domain-containing protein [Bacteroidetes bacterium]|nr:PAS domain-containing protein [Bacteroidota bacterium]